LSNALVFAVPIVVVLINSVARLVLKKLSILEKAYTIVEQKYQATRNMSLLTIMNTALAIILINMQIAGVAEVSWFPVLNGAYQSFDADWYKNVGSALVLTLITTILATAVGNLAFGCIYACLRCCDRSCNCCNDRKTRQLTQENYENKNLGSNFELEMRYNGILTVMFVTMIYSAGLPILYLIAAAYFAVMYWVDKYLMLRHYRKPPMYDATLALKVIGWFKYALFLHFLLASAMFANTGVMKSFVDLGDLVEEALSKASVIEQEGLGDIF
jgi:hypothetical protein